MSVNILVGIIWHFQKKKKKLAFSQKMRLKLLAKEKMKTKKE